MMTATNKMSITETTDRCGHGAKNRITQTLSSRKSKLLAQFNCNPVFLQAEVTESHKLLSWEKVGYQPGECRLTCSPKRFPKIISSEVALRNQPQSCSPR